MELKKAFNLLFKLNILKTLYYTIKYSDGLILIGKKYRLNIHKKAKIICNGGHLYLGVGITYHQTGCLDMYENAIFEISGNVSIHKGGKIMIGPSAKLKIGAQTYINEHSRIQCREKIEIGEKCAISWGVDIIDTDEHIILSPERQSKTRPVKIGNHVWIGTKSTILKGTNIEDNTVIAANSLVNTACHSNNIYGGIPCKIIKSNIQWE